MSRATEDRVLVVSLSVVLPQGEAISLVTDELARSLRRLGVEAELRAGGKVSEAGRPVGRVVDWRPGEGFTLEWDSTPWEKAEPCLIRVGCAAEGDGSRISFEIRGLDRPVGDAGGELIGWAADGLLAPVLAGLAPTRFGDWITDRRVRRPSGRRSEEIYRDPTFHWPNFLLILDRLRLAPKDRLLEVGCGGGAFVHRALESGCTAVGVDHSPEMLRTALASNDDAVREGRLTLVEAEADRLPVPDEEFSCAVSTGVFGFLSDPIAALREMHRAMRPGARLVIFSGTAALRGTPACPEPMASRIRFYEDAELAELAARAGFVEIRVEQPAMRAYAERAGLPPDAVRFFDELGGAQLLLARKAG